MTTIKIKITNTQEDYLNFIKFLQTESLSRERSLLLSNLSQRSLLLSNLIGLNIINLAYWIVITVCAFILTTGKNTDYPTLLLAGIIFFSFYWWTCFTQVKKEENWNKRCSEGPFIGDREYLFTNTGIEIHRKNVEAKLSWKAVMHIKKSNDYFFIFVDINQAFVFPKREIENFEEVFNEVKLLFTKATSS